MIFDNFCSQEIVFWCPYKGNKTRFCSVIGTEMYTESDFL